MAENEYIQNMTPAGQQWFAAEQPAKKHSGLGIASFVLAIVAFLIMFVLVVMAGVMTTVAGGRMDEQSPQAVVVGCSMILTAMLYILGIGLAIGGLCQRNRYKIFSILGLVLNIVFILGIAMLMLIGILSA
ncbi:MAG: hypothetical protein WC374_06490 [Phycisphaerae bacterium]|jgi:uncharacterized membrane protein YjgN (DUF898 family)